MEKISQKDRNKIINRYHHITRAINNKIWNIDSDTKHSLYVGSYGRHTAISKSDIDMLIEMKKEDYDRYDDLKYNGQSRLLQTVRNAVLEKYTFSDVRADGQVIKVNFSDNIKFEILPAFINDMFNNQYIYPDTNQGGKWLSTDPKDEQKVMIDTNKKSNGLLFDTCKCIRSIREKRNYKIPGIVIDSFVYHNISNWHWINPNEPCIDNNTLENNLKRTLYIDNLTGLTAPGSNQYISNAFIYHDDLSKALNILAEE